MGFRDEIIKARRKVTPYLRFAKAVNPNAPWAGPDERLYAAAEVATGALPMKGHVISFGSFSRSFASALFSLEIPGLTCTLFDEEADWRKYANEPYDTLLRRWLHILLRVYDDREIPFDATVALGQIQGVSYPPGRKVTLTSSITPPELLGARIPRRTITLDEWPSAPPESVGRAVPILYGNLTNSVKTDDGSGGGAGAIPACPCPEWLPEPYTYGVSNTAPALHWSDAFSHAHGSKENGSYTGAATDGWLVKNYHGILDMDIEVGTGREGGNLLVPTNNHGYSMITRGIGVQLRGYPEQGSIVETPPTEVDVHPRYGLQAGQQGAAGFLIYPTAPFNKDKPQLLSVWGPAAGGDIEGCILGVQVWDDSYPGERCTDLYLYTLGHVNARGEAIPQGGEAGYVTRWQTAAMQNCLTPDTWHLVELRWKMASTTFTDYLYDGWVELYLNGNLLCKLQDWKSGLDLPPEQRRLPPLPETRRLYPPPLPEVQASDSFLVPYYDINVTDNVDPLPVHPAWRGGNSVQVWLDATAPTAVIEVGFGFSGPVPEPLTASGLITMQWGGPDNTVPGNDDGYGLAGSTAWIVAVVGGVRVRALLWDAPVPTASLPSWTQFRWRDLYEQVGGDPAEFFANISIEIHFAQTNPFPGDEHTIFPIFIGTIDANVGGGVAPGGTVYFNYWEGVAYAPMGKCACLYLTDGPLCDWGGGEEEEEEEPVCDENVGQRAEGAVPALLVGVSPTSDSQLHRLHGIDTPTQNNDTAPQNAIAYGFPGFGSIPPNVMTYYRVTAVLNGQESSWSSNLGAIHDTPHFDRVEWDPPPQGADKYRIYQTLTPDLSLHDSDGGVLRDETFWVKEVPGDQEPGGHLPADQASPSRHWVEFSRQGEGTALIAAAYGASDSERTLYVLAGHGIQGVSDVYTTLTDLDEDDNEVERFVRLTPDQYNVSLVEKPSGVFAVLEVIVRVRKPKTCNYPPVTVNVKGITDNADGSGTLIENGAYILRHFLLNWVFNHYERGNWFTDVADAPGLIDQASFDEMALVDYRGAVALLEPGEARQHIMDALTSFDLMFFYRNGIDQGAGSWAVGRFDTRWFDASQDTSPLFRQDRDMLSDTFQTEMNVDLMANVITYKGGPNYTGGGDSAYVVVGSMTDENSIIKGWGRIEREMELLWTRDQNTASEVVASQLSLRSFPVITGSFETVGRGILIEPSGRIRINSPDAPGLGWATRVALIIGNDLNLDTGTTTLRFLSSVSMVGGGGGGTVPPPPAPVALPLGTIMVGGHGASNVCAYLAPNGSQSYAQPPSQPVPGVGVTSFCRLYNQDHIGQVGGGAPRLYNASDLTVRAEYAGGRSDGVLIAADMFERDSDELGYWYVARCDDALHLARLNDHAQEVQTWDIPIPAVLVNGNQSPAMAVDWHDQRLYIWMTEARPGTPVWQIHIFSLSGMGSYLGVLPLDYNRGTPGAQSLLIDPNAFILAAFNNLNDEDGGVIRSYWRTGQPNWTSVLPDAERGNLLWNGLAQGNVIGYSDALFLAWAHDRNAEGVSPSACRYVWFHYLNGQPTASFQPSVGDFRFDSQFVVLAQSIKGQEPVA